MPLKRSDMIKLSITLVMQQDNISLRSRSSSAIEFNDLIGLAASLAKNTTYSRQSVNSRGVMFAIAKAY